MRMSLGSSSQRTGLQVLSPTNRSPHRQKKQKTHQKLKENRTASSSSLLSVTLSSRLRKKKDQDQNQDQEAAASSSDRTSRLRTRKEQETQCSVTKWSIECFEMGKKLGAGCFGNVFLARERQSKFICCVKTINKTKLKGKQEILLREIELQRSVSHPHVIQLYQWFYDKKKIYLVLEYAIRGELKKMLDREVEHRDRGFSESRSAMYMYQCASALKALHDLHILHRDIKPENILVGSNGELKLADFGWSKRTKDQTYTFCGTQDYLCPEILKEGTLPTEQTSGHSFALDLWCLGVLAFELIVGDAPFSWENPDIEVKEIYKTWPKPKKKKKAPKEHWQKKLYRRIQEVDVQYPSYFTKEGRNFVNDLLKEEPSERMRLEKFTEHPWMRDHLQRRKVEEIFNLPLAKLKVLKVPRK